MRALRFGAPALLLFSLVAGLRADSHVRIVRLSLVVGAVQVKLPDGRGWRPALLDAPLVQGEQVRTLGSGRAEIQFENGSTLRLIPDTQVDLTRLALSNAGVFETTARVGSGTAFATLRKQDSKDFRITLAGDRWVQAHGDARLRVNATAGAQPLAVLAGKAELYGNGKPLMLKKNQAALFTGGGSARRVDIAAPAGPWTKWSEKRDQYYAAAFHSGVQAGGLTSVVNWDANLASPMPAYSGIGLNYVGTAACPWTMSGGDYSGWCWSNANGWFFPDQPPMVGMQAASASDVSQTNSVLASASASPFNVMFYGGSAGFYGGSLGFGSALGMLGAPFLCDQLCMQAYYGPTAFDFGGGPWMGGGYYPLVMPAGGALSVRTAAGPSARLPLMRGPLGLRPGTGVGSAAILRPPPAPHAPPPMENRFDVRGAGGAPAAFRPGLRPSGVMLSHTNFRDAYRPAVGGAARFAAPGAMPAPVQMSAAPMSAPGGFHAGAPMGGGGFHAGAVSAAGGRIVH